MGDAIKPFFIEMPIAVKTYDIDALHHVSNIVYIRWLEDLRLKMLETYLPLDALMAKDISPVLIRTEIEYRRPIRLFDSPVGTCYVSSVGPVRIVMSADFIVEGEVVAEAKQTGCFFNMKRQRPVKLPAAFLEQYDRFLKEGGSAF